jgi:hypothetical protein
MGCKETCPDFPTKRITESQIQHPKGKSIDIVRNVKDLIEDKVRVLIEGIE